MNNSFEKIVLPIFGVFGTLITILTFIFPTYASVNVSLSIYVATILILLLLCSIFIKINIDLKKTVNDNVFFNNFSLTPIQYIQGGEILIVERKISIPLNTAVSIYLRNENYEQLLTIGYVSHVQEKLIQIKIIALTREINEIFIKKEILKSTVIRPAANINDLIQKIEKERAV